ncbi:MAG TPA: protease pro-enzyme activation domain-containing protein [Solirubrobacterales bacterium]|nr:protease pro-enzyme activation domain-containing protein [Solirubrobacterales bacterium]
MRRIAQTTIALLAALACLPVATAAGNADGVVRIGPPPPLPEGATVEGDADAGKELQLMVALQPRDPAALERFANAVSTPGSGSFGDYVSVPEFARRFGATPADIAGVRTALEREGLDIGAAGRNHLSLPVTDTVAAAEEAFGVSIQRVRLMSGRVAYRNNRAPAIPADAPRSSA